MNGIMYIVNDFSTLLYQKISMSSVVAMMYSMLRMTIGMTCDYSKLCS